MKMIVPEIKLQVEDNGVIITGKELQLNLKELEGNEIYKILLTEITDKILTSGITTINAYIEKIIENVSRQPGQLVLPYANAKDSPRNGGARKKTKRKKQKNNKVSQRKNRIKVKKHASRKFRAKGKSKKGRKL